MTKKLTTHFTKQKLLRHLSKKTGLTKTSINLVFTELLETINEHMKKDGPEKFVLPGIFKLTTKHLPSQEERTGINPFTREKMIFKAKPASRKIKIKPLKKLKNTTID